VEFAKTLDREELDLDPITQFKTWFDQALQADLHEATGMTLATVTAEGKPCSRIVLLKSFDRDGFVFFTNYNSKKAEELANNPWASLTFWWDKLERQVHILGKVEKIDAASSEQYFNSRPRGSQIGAWASPQSQELANREELQQSIQAMTEKFEGKSVPCPEHWGGYLVRPERIEFWQGRSDRLHDRFTFELSEQKEWEVKRLAP